VASELDDQTVPLPDHPGVLIRLGRGHIVLVTSLVGVAHDARAIADLYQRRWGIETAYREAKGGMD
jgi:IS4 transposase